MSVLTIRRICTFSGITLRELRELLALEPVSWIIMKGRLRWLGQVEREVECKNDADCAMTEVDGTRQNIAV